MKRFGRAACGLLVAWGVLLGLPVLSGCGSGKPNVAEEPVKPRKRDPRATPDDPQAEAVKPPAPPEGETTADLSGLTPVERDAIAALKKNAGQQESPPPPPPPQAEPRPTGRPIADMPAAKGTNVPAAKGAGAKVTGLGPWVEYTGPVPPVPVRGAKPEPEMLLAKVRRELKWRITRDFKSGTPVDVPPPGVFDLVKYKSSVGDLAAYVSPDPKDGTKRPAIVWITGGNSNTIGNVWDDIDLENEQSATAYRNAGIVMMFPSLRGGNQNPGRQEGFLNEVEDVIAAGEYVSKLPYVDANRVYLGGHSSGGTMALLTAESTTRFRAVFAFGPAASIAGYGKDTDEMPLPFDHTNSIAVGVRSPLAWLNCVERPTFVIEGEDGNYNDLLGMKKKNRNPYVTFLGVKGADHFSILHPVNTLIAEKIRQDKTPESNITITEAELQKAMGK